jgi:peptidoglycan hydrolase-like protein with peptidoglycan-binding domain
MRKAALVAAGALALPFILSLPAAAQHLMEQSQDEGMRQAQAAGQKQLSPDQIKQVQQALEEKGFPVTRTDGVVGPDTLQALSEFQRQHRLQPTGLPDDHTLQALGIDLNGSTSGAATTTGAAPSDQPDQPDQYHSDNAKGAN